MDKTPLTVTNTVPPGTIYIMNAKPTRCPHLENLNQWDDPAWIECRARELTNDGAIVVIQGSSHGTTERPD